MARYIDADAVEKRIVDYYDAQLQSFPSSKGEEKRLLLGGINYGRNVVRDAPTADVVPKSEVAILSFQNAALRDSFGILHKALDEAESRVASEIFDVVDELIDRICAMTGVNIILFGKYVELKKKYGVGGTGEGDE